MPASHTGTESLRFAVLSDTHVVPWRADRVAALRRIFASVSAGRPHAVVHCGDQTESGTRSELRTYLDTVPPDIAPILHNVPGNHEIRWDPTAGGTFTDLIGATEFAFDADGVHFVGLDPTQILQEPGLFTEAGLGRLSADLYRVGRTTPTLIFLHFPLGANNHYVNDQDRFLDTIAEFNVRALFAGHIHAEQVHSFNGLTQVACDDAVGSPGYYWVERIGPGRPVLAVTRVAVAADGTETRTHLTTIRLDGSGEGRRERPDAVRPGIPDAGVLPVRVTLPPRARAHAVRGRIHPQHRHAAKDADPWFDFTATTATTWSGALDVSTLSPGAHRVAVEIRTSGHAAYAVTTEVTVPGGLTGRVTELAVDGSVQAGIAVHGDRFVAATTDGEVRCWRLRADDGPPQADPLWDVRLGPVYRTPAFTADGSNVVIPCADNRLVAVDGESGTPRWTVGAEAPVLSVPVITTIGGREAVVFSAAGALCVVDVDSGAPLWRNAGHGIFAGRAACDGDRVYAGGGDGSAHAYDAATGTELWAFSTNPRANPYHRRIYGPWDGWVTRLPDGLILVSTVSNAHALDPVRGAEVWAVPGSFVYAEALATEHGLVLVGEQGQVRLSDPHTGAARMVVETGVRVLGTGARVRARTAWVLGTTGQLVAVDLSSGTVTGRNQLGTAHSYSAPALVGDGDVLATADQAGVLRLTRLPPR